MADGLRTKKYRHMTNVTVQIATMEIFADVRFSYRAMSLTILRLAKGTKILKYGYSWRGDGKTVLRRYVSNAPCTQIMYRKCQIANTALGL